MKSRRSFRWSPVLAALLVTSVSSTGALGQELSPSTPALYGGGKVGYRFPLKGLPDLVLPSMDPAKGRKYFGSRACVVCHMVNGIGGTRGAALNLESPPPALDLIGFFARMLRHGAPMLALQRRLFGEQIQLTAEELGAIIAFLHSPSEQDRFSMDDIPEPVRIFMESGSGKKRP